MAKRKKTKRASRKGITAKMVQLQLRATIDELERGQCVRAGKQLITAAHTLGATAKRKNARMVKVRAHFTEVEKFFERACVKGAAGSRAPSDVPFHPVQPRPQVDTTIRPAVWPGYDMSYQAGPRHPLPGQRPPDVRPMPNRPPPSYQQHSHPFIDGLGGLGGGYKNPHGRVNSEPVNFGTRRAGYEPFSHPVRARPAMGEKVDPELYETRLMRNGKRAVVPRKTRRR